MKLVLHPDADAEIAEAIEYYLLRDAKIASNFYRAYLQTRQLICENPHRYPVVRPPDIRKHSLPQFPYHLIYRVATTEGTQSLQILAIAHHRRRPYYWQQRTK
jgi:toxin ParE1/3/4